MRLIMKLIPVLGVSSLLAACGSGSSDRPKTAAVSGKVLYKGQPLADAGVIFLPVTYGDSSASAIR